MWGVALLFGHSLAERRLPVLVRIETDGGFPQALRARTYCSGVMPKLRLKCLFSALWS